MTLNTCLKPAYGFCFFFYFFHTNTAHSQVYGCNDPLANNYTSSATANNGKCTYNATSYTPVIKVDPINNILIENSGLQMAGNYLWTYRIDTLTNAILQTVNLSGATNVDWEDIAFDGKYFYVGDFGNNAHGSRTDLKIYKFPFSAIPDFVSNPNAIIPSTQIDRITFSYSDQPQPLVDTPSDSTRYDCEAMLIDGGKIHLFTKDWIDTTTTHYIINTTLPGNYILDPVEALPTGFLVTAADKTPRHGTIALLGYQNSGFGNHFMELLSSYHDGYYFNGNKRIINLPDASVMGQSEGITFRDSTYGYISNEKFVRSIGSFVLTVNQKLRSFNIKAFISPEASTVYTFIGNGNWEDPVNWSNNKIPPSTITAGSKIIIDPPLGEDCILNVPYTLSSDSIFIVNAGKKFLIQGNLLIQ